MYGRQQIGLVVDGSDHFIRPIEASLRKQYRVTRFAPRFLRAPVVGMSVNKVLLHLQFSQFLRRHDVVFFEWAGSLLVRATHMPKTCKIVTRLHSIEIATAADRVDWSRVDAAIVVSEQMRRRLLDVVNAQPHALTVINNGVDLARFRPAPRRFQHRIGMACRVEPVKRVYDAVVAVYELRWQGHPFTLDVAGAMDGGRSPRYPLAIQALVENLGLSEAVTLQGHVDDMPTFYRQVDIFLSNSYWEGQQSALLEAMASGCYCLSHCWGGAEEVVPPENVFVTGRELRQRLIRYAALDEVEKQRTQAGLRQIAEERFDERRMVADIACVIAAAARATG